jgi:hypothetical protein
MIDQHGNQVERGRRPVSPKKVDALTCLDASQIDVEQEREDRQNGVYMGPGKRWVNGADRKHD